MTAIWNWIGSASYWRLAAIFTGVYLAIAVLGKTQDWWLTGAVALGFYLCWTYSAYANGITGESK